MSISIGKEFYGQNNLIYLGDKLVSEIYSGDDLVYSTEGMEFTELLYDCESSQNLKKTVFDHSPRGLLYIEYSYRQLGYTDEWFRYNTARSQASREAILKDFLNVWQNSSERTIIPPELLEKMSRSTKEPTHTDIGDAFVTKYYVNMNDSFKLIK